MFSVGYMEVNGQMMCQSRPPSSITIGGSIPLKPGEGAMIELSGSNVKAGARMPDLLCYNALNGGLMQGYSE